LRLVARHFIEVADLGLNTSASSEPDAKRRTPHNASSFRALKQEMIETFERDYLIRLMAAHHGNITQAARSAGKERRDLGKLLKKYHLDPNNFRAANQFT